jgi:hypothetical protein
MFMYLCAGINDMEIIVLILHPLLLPIPFIKKISLAILSKRVFFNFRSTYYINTIINN